MAYIDKELFKQDIKMRYCNNCARPNDIKCRACHVDDMLGEIEDAPTADVVEVRHGEWKRINHGTICTNCYRVFDNDFEFSNKDIRTYFKRCPECGAKMDGTPKERGGEK